MTPTDWQRAYETYRGPVRVVLDDLSILHGVALGSRDHEGGPQVQVESPRGIAWYEQPRVWPAAWRYESRRAS